MKITIFMLILTFFTNTFAMQLYLTMFPNEILIEICNHLKCQPFSPRSYHLAIAQTCKRFKKIIPKTLFPQSVKVFKNLHKAAREGQLSEVKNLINELQTTYKLSLADIFLPQGANKSGDTLMHCAARSNNTALCFYLINVYEEYRKNHEVKGFLPLIKKQYKQLNAEHYKILFEEKGFNPNGGDFNLNQLINKEGNCPCECTTDEKISKKLCLLKNNVTPIDFILWTGNKKYIRMFLQNKPFLHIQYGDIPLAKAILYSQTLAIEELLRYGADPNVVYNSRRWRPLHLACNVGTLKAINLLLNANANPHLTNNKGHKPIYYITYQHDPRKKKLLQKAMARKSPGDNT